MSKSTSNKLLALSLTTAISLATTSAIAAPDETFSFGSQIVDAAESGNIHAVQNFIASGISPNEAGEFGATPLMRAAYNNNPEMVKLLLNSGADVNVKDIGGASALSIAAREGHENVVKLLVSAGADVNMADAEGITPLMRAIMNEKIGAEEVLAEADGKVDTKSIQVAAAKNQANREADIVLEMSGGKLGNKTEIAANQLSEQYHERAMARQQLAQAVKPMSSYPVQAEYSVGSVKVPAKAEYFEPAVAPQVAPSTAKFYPPVKDTDDVNSTAQRKQTIEWLAKLERVMAEQNGSYELAAAGDDIAYKAGGKYNVLDLGSFKDESFANKKIADLKSKFPDVFGDLQLKAVQKNVGGNATYQVNAGVIQDKDKAAEICKKLILAGVNCRPTETMMMSQDEFNQYKGEAPQVAKAEAPAAAPAPSVPSKDLLGAAPSPQVSSKELKSVADAPKEAPKPVEVAKAPEPAKPALAAPAPKAPEVKASDNIASISALEQQEEESSIFDIFDGDKEPAAAPAVEAPKPVEVAKAPEAPKPALAAAPVPAQPKSDDATFKELKDMVSKDAKEEKVEIVEKKEIQSITAKEGKVVEQTSKTEVSKTTVPAEAPKPALAEAPKPVAAAPLPAPKPVPLNPEIALPSLPGVEEKKPEPVKVAEAPKPVEEPKPVVAPLAAKSSPKMEMEVADAKPEPVKPEPKVEVKAEAPKPVAAPKVEVKETPQMVKAAPAAPAKFEVARPVKVVDSTPPIAPSHVDVPVTPSAPIVATYKQPESVKQIGASREYWAKINYFDDNDSARNYWNSLQAANPSLNGLRFRATTPLNNVNKVSAEIGPFANAMEARGLCDSLAAQGMSCEMTTNIPVKYGNSVPMIGTTGRHSQKVNPLRRGGLSFNQRHSYNPSTSSYQPTFYPRHSDGQQEARALGDINSVASGYTLQFGSYSSHEEAEAVWKSVSKNRDAKKLANDIVMDNGSYRLRAGSFSNLDQAEKLCDKLRAKSVSCIIVRA